MAEKKVIEIQVNTGDAQKNVNALTNDIKKLDEETEKVGDAGLGNLQKGAKDSTNSVGGLSGGFKGLGVAIKATGIGLIVTLLAKLAQELGENERVSKFFRIATEALSMVFQDFINFIIDNTGSVVDFFKAIFEDPLGSVEKLGELIKANLIERFNSLIEVTGFLSDALSKLFEGDFKGAFESLKEAGKESLDVLSGVDNTVDKVKDGFNNAVEGISNYATSIVDAAEKTVNLRDAAVIAAAQQSRLVEQYDRQAEKLRQIRDNDLKSIDERIKANNELLSVLDEQQKALLKEADLQLAAAQAEAARSSSVENRAAVVDALANREGVLAQIEGFRSEQEANRIALEKERLDLNQARIDGETERALKEKEFAVQQEQDTLARLELEKSVLEQEKLIEEERLQNKVDSFALGTQARIDAENELENRLQELRFASLENEKAINDEKDRIESESIKQREDEAKALEQTKEVLITDGLKTVQGLLKKNSAASKGLAAAQTIFDTQQGITSALAAKSPSDQLLPFPVRLANAAIVGVKGALALRNILKTNPEKGGGSSPSTGGGGQAAPPAPAFNLIGQGGGINQIDQSLQQEQQPIQAFVVSGNVTSAQELDRNIVDTATIV
jgi:hypothetical protein